jgi:hypothetical protein
VKGRIHIQTHRLRAGFMKDAVEMGSVAMIHIPSFIKIGSDIQKLKGGGYANTQIGWRSHKPTFRKRLKISNCQLLYIPTYEEKNRGEEA